MQGDERDIILLSICYGPDANGRMLMNFGPINQRGGEKRLNVIFSRARHHMAVVSSIRHDDITNDYNDGARALKNFLHYAQSVSRGDHAAARQVLENLNPLKRRSLAPATKTSVVATQMAPRCAAAGGTRNRTWGKAVSAATWRCVARGRASTSSRCSSTRPSPRVWQSGSTRSRASSVRSDGRS